MFAEEHNCSILNSICTGCTLIRWYIFSCNATWGKWPFWLWLTLNLTLMHALRFRKFWMMDVMPPLLCWWYCKDNENRNGKDHDEEAAALVFAAKVIPFRGARFTDHGRIVPWAFELLLIATLFGSHLDENNAMANYTIAEMIVFKHS